MASCSGGKCAKGLEEALMFVFYALGRCWPARRSCCAFSPRNVYNSVNTDQILGSENTNGDRPMIQALCRARGLVHSPLRLSGPTWCHRGNKDHFTAWS